MKCKHENKNGTCGLKGSYAYLHKCFTEDLCKCFEPLSNADRIRGMNDVELLKFIAAAFTGGMVAEERGDDFLHAFPWTLDWLHQPAEEVHDGQTI